MRNTQAVVAAAAVSMILVGAAPGASTAGEADQGIPTPVAVAGYDIQSTAVSGFGCWDHAYSGTIVNTGRTVSGSVVCIPPDLYGFFPAPIADYSGGSGTLNDGLESAAQLFVSRPDDAGVMIQPALVLHLASASPIQSIDLLGGVSIFGGNITEATVEIGENGQRITATPFGPANMAGAPSNDRLDLTGTDLAGIVTDTVVIRDLSLGGTYDQFTISEITVTGTQLPTPEVLLAQLVAAVSGLAPGSALVDKASNAQLLFAEGRVKPTCNELAGLVALVNAQTGKKLDEGVAQDLIAQVRRISVTLGC